MSKLSCESCGANLDPSHLACPFCKAPTAYAREQHAQEDRARQQQHVAEAVAKQRYDAASRANAQTELDRLARQSVVWSGVGVLFCCFPIPSLVALVLVYRARALAREKSFVFPTMATVGLILSVMTLLSSVGFYVFAGVSAAQKQRQIHALESSLGAKASEETLDHDTACTLVKIELLSHGYKGYSDVSDVKCDGAIEQHGVTATLRDVTFTASTSFFTANASLRRGARWVVERVADAAAPGPTPNVTPTANATATTPATPKPASSTHVAPPHHPGAPSAAPAPTSPKPH